MSRPNLKTKMENVVVLVEKLVENQADTRDFIYHKSSKTFMKHQNSGISENCVASEHQVGTPNHTIDFKSLVSDYSTTAAH